MIYLEGLMHKKINFWIALLILIIIATAVAWALSASAKTASFYFGGWVTYYQPACVYVPLCNCCPNCPICTMYGPACGGMQEVQFTPTGGMSNHICPLKTFRFFGGLPRPGGFIIGWGFSPTILKQVGVSR